MDFDSGFPSLGGAHVYRFEPESGDRLRYIKTPQQANAKWVASTSQGEATWAQNLQQTTKPIVGAAIAARSKMQANFNAATQPGGVWERRLEQVGDGGIKSAAQAKKANYSTGVQQASAKQLSAITKILAYEQAGLGTLTPKSGAGSGRTRMNEWFDYMSAGRGTLGA
jgi:hypothetical protein